MKKEKVLSISVAAYNVEKFIEQNLDSFVNSKVRDLGRTDHRRGRYVRIRARQRHFGQTGRVPDDQREIQLFHR